MARKVRNKGRYRRLPYVKPEARFVELRPEERLMYCVKDRGNCPQPKKFS